MGCLIEGGLQRSLHDRPDGPGATSAFRTAPKAGLNLGRRTRAIGTAMEARTHGVVGQDVTGADDHAESELALGIVPVGKIQSHDPVLRWNARLEQLKTATFSIP